MDDNEFAAWQSVINNVNNATNVISQSNINKRTRAWNEMMYSKQRADAISDWNMQNEYNAPNAQMERLKKAGLNPNLVYGKGADVISTSMPRGTDTKAWNPQAPRMEKDTGLTDYVNLQAQGLQMDNLRAQNTVLVNEASLKKAQEIATLKGAGLKDWQLNWNIENHDLLKQGLTSTVENKDIDFEAKRLRNEWYERTQSLTLEQMAQQILESKARQATTEEMRKEIEQRIQNLKTGNQLQEFERQLNEYGVTRNDEPWWRALVKILGLMK